MGLGRLQAWMLGLPTAVVYGSLALFISVLHNVFLLYYVDTFVSVYKINKTAFWVGEVGQHWVGARRIARLGPTQSGAWGWPGCPPQFSKKSWSWSFDKCSFISWINSPWMGGSLMGGGGW